MPDSEEKLFSDKYSDPGFTEFDEEMVSWISTHYKHPAVVEVVDDVRITDLPRLEQNCEKAAQVAERRGRELLRHRGHRYQFR